MPEERARGARNLAWQSLSCGAGAANPNEGQRTMRRRTMIQPPAAAAAVIPSSHVRVGGEKETNNDNNNNNNNKRLMKDESLDEVPSDIWFDILSRLPLESMKGARLVCRAWNTILTLTLHHHPTLTPASLLYSDCVHKSTRIINSPSYPYLKLIHPPTSRDLLATFMYLPDPCTHLPLIDRLLQPIASCHGLVCFLPRSKQQDQIFVANPLLKEELLMVPGSDITMTHRHTVYASADIVGFGFSPKTNRYKVMQFVFLSKEPHVEYQEYFNICTLCNTNQQQSPLWRSILNFPRQFLQGIQGNPLGSYLKGGIYWLLWDEDGGSVFISRLDLDTEQFGRVKAPQTSDFNTAKECLEDMCLGVSDGYLNICANLCSEEVDVWVMKGHNNSWTKQFVIANPSTILPGHHSRIEILNYAAVEAATRRGAVALVMLLFAKNFFLASATKVWHLWKLDGPPRSSHAIVHIPSFLSIKDATKM